MSEVNTAMDAARSSWRAVQAKDKQGWLDLMAEDICVEDPIGVGPTNPSGKGIQGKAALSDFYDKHMGSSTISIETHESYTSQAPDEVAHVMTLSTTLSNGVKTRVRGIFTYKTNDEGKITNLRGYWNMSSMEFEKPA
jgi:steroid delta-isomerase